MELKVLREKESLNVENNDLKKKIQRLHQQNVELERKTGSLLKWVLNCTKLNIAEIRNWCEYISLGQLMRFETFIKSSWTKWKFAYQMQNKAKHF